MTRLEAELKDFTIRQNAENEIIAWRFRFGYCEDWNETFQEFKTRIHFNDRTPSPELDWLWEIKATPLNRMVMADIFDNFESSLQLAESQLRLFG